MRLVGVRVKVASLLIIRFSAWPDTLRLLDQTGTTFTRQMSDRSEISLNCVMPGCTDNRLRLGINVATGQAHCYNCGWKSGSLVHTLRSLCTALNVPFRPSKFLDTEEPEPAKEILPSETGLPDGFEHFGEGKADKIERQAKRYLTSRGITDNQIERHCIGYAAAGDFAYRVIFPVFNRKGKVFGCVGRDFSGKQQAKYYNTPGIKLLWNGARPGRAAIMVEGVMDALRVENVVPSGIVPVVCLGSSITPAQLRQLRKYQYIVDFPDRDEAGVKGAASRCAEYVKMGLNASIVVPSELDDVDPGAMTDAQVMEQLKLAVPWSSEHTPARLRAVKRKKGL
jgi:hypothetical protein